MKQLFLVIFLDEVVKTFTTYAKASAYVYNNGNADYVIQEVNYE